METVYDESKGKERNKNWFMFQLVRNKHKTQQLFFLFRLRLKWNFNSKLREITMFQRHFSFHFDFKNVIRTNHSWARFLP